MQPTADSFPTALPGQSLRNSDYLLLALYSMVLFAGPLVCGRVLTGHESVLPESTREMLARHDWLVPRLGGEPWLERPPLPSHCSRPVGLSTGRAR